jgi:hypothetical protein
VRFSGASSSGRFALPLRNPAILGLPKETVSKGETPVKRLRIFAGALGFPLFKFASMLGAISVRSWVLKSKNPPIMPLITLYS